MYAGAWKTPKHKLDSWHKRPATTYLDYKDGIFLLFFSFTVNRFDELIHQKLTWRLQKGNGIFGAESCQWDLACT